MEKFELIVLAMAIYDEIWTKSLENHVLPSSDEEICKQVEERLKEYGYKE